MQSLCVPKWPNLSCLCSLFSFRSRGLELSQEYAADLHAELSRVISQSSSRGIFLSSCISGVTPQQAWREWYGGLRANESSVTTKWVEECADGLPCNPNTLSCAPYT